MSHKVSISIGANAKLPLTRVRRFRLPQRVLTALFGEPNTVSVIVVGKSVESVDIKDSTAG